MRTVFVPGAMRAAAVGAATALALASALAPSGASAVPTAAMRGLLPPGPLASLSALAVARDGQVAVGGQACEDDVAARCHGIVAMQAAPGGTWTTSDVGGYGVTALAYAPGGTLWAQVQTAPACTAQPGSCRTLLRTRARYAWHTVLATDRTVSAVLPGPGGDAWVALGACPSPPSRLPVCSSSTLLATADGGRRWRQASAEHAWIAALALRGTSLWALAARSRGLTGIVQVEVSRDGGRTFQTLGTVVRQPGMGLPTRLTGELAFGPGGVVWTALSDADSCAMHGCLLDGLYLSGGGGRTWQALDWPAGADVCPFGTPLLAAAGGEALATVERNLAACAPPATSLVAASAAGSGPRLVHRWPDTFLRALAVTPDRRVWALTAGGLIVSDDAGQRWQPAWPAATPESALDPVGGGAVFGAGDQAQSSAVLESTDQGRIWRQVGALPVDRIAALSFVDARLGYAIGEAGPDGACSLWRTADGGRTWRFVRALPAGAPLALRFFTAERAGLVWSSASQNRLALLQSGDGGRTFRAVAAIPEYGRGGFVEAAALAAPREAWLVVARRDGTALLRRLTAGGLGASAALRIAGTTGYGAQVEAGSDGFLAVAVGLPYHPRPGFGTGEQAELFLRAGAARPWHVYLLPREAGAVAALAFRSPSDGWLITGAPFLTGTAAVWHTGDGGAVWATPAP